MVYADTTSVILYWNPDMTFIVHRAHHVWFDEYNPHQSIKAKHNTGYLIPKQDPEILIHNS